MLIAALIARAEKGEQLLFRCTDIHHVIYPYNRILFGHKKK